MVPGCAPGNRVRAMICPDCKGEKHVFAHINRGGPERSGFEWIDCTRCKGAGAVRDEQGEWIVLGRRFRQDRIARGLSLQEEAKRLGIPVVQLSEMERGVREWSQVPQSAGQSDTP